MNMLFLNFQNILKWNKLTLRQHLRFHDSTNICMENENYGKEMQRWKSVYLNGLSMFLEDVHTNHSFVKLWVQRLDYFIVQMFLQLKK